MASSVHIDWTAMDKVIYETMRGPVDEAAAKIAANTDVSTVDTQVTVRTGKTGWGWPVAMVTIPHPAGLSLQAKHGSLTKAAASVGLEVRSK